MKADGCHGHADSSWESGEDPECWGILRLTVAIFLSAVMEDGKMKSLEGREAFINV